MRRPPDFVIGGSRRPYLRRWWLLPRNRWFNVYVHEIMRSDDDRALHDHPWWNVSIILRGSYREVVPAAQYQDPVFDFDEGGTVSRVHRRGSIVLRSATHSHRLEVVDGPVWTLFITGPRVRELGFRCRQGWVHWKIFTSVHDHGDIGKGCEA